MVVLVGKEAGRGYQESADGPQPATYVNAMYLHPSMQDMYAVCPPMTACMCITWQL